MIVDRYLEGATISRRQLLARPVRLAAGLAALSASVDPLLAAAGRAGGPDRLGATFSARQAEYLGLDARETLDAVLAAGFEPLRLVAYWSQVERQPGAYDWSPIEWQLARAKRAGRRIILAFGAKAPRYPEFHAPDWLRARVERGGLRYDSDPLLLERGLQFQERLLTMVGEDEMIEYIQPGNEGPRASVATEIRRLSVGYERAIVEAARRLTRKPVLLTVGMPILVWEFVLQVLSGGHREVMDYVKLGDAVGFNPFISIGGRMLGIRANVGPGPHFWPYLAWLRWQAVREGKTPMVAELQAEPYDHAAEEWGRDPNITPEQTSALHRRLRRMGFGTQLVWGVEFAWWRRSTGDSRYWDTLVRLAAGAGAVRRS